MSTNDLYSRALSYHACQPPGKIQIESSKPIIFAMANRDPEIIPKAALLACGDAIICTGRSDDSNQVNNMLAFPYIFKGALDILATKITVNMKIAAVRALIKLAREAPNFSKKKLLPTPFNMALRPTVSRAVSLAAIKDDVNLKALACGEAAPR